MQIIWENENLVCKQQGNIKYLQFKKLLKFPEITHCYTLKSDNELSFPAIYKDAELLKNKDFTEVDHAY